MFRKKTYGSCAIELVPSFHEFAVCLLKIAKRESDEESRQLGLEVLSEGLYIAGQNPCDSYVKVQMHLAKAKAFLMKNEYVLAMNHYLIALPMLERFLNGSDDKKLATSYYDAAVALRESQSRSMLYKCILFCEKAKTLCEANQEVFCNRFKMRVHNLLQDLELEDEES